MKLNLFNNKLDKYVKNPSIYAELFISYNLGIISSLLFNPGRANIFSLLVSYLPVKYFKGSNNGENLIKMCFSIS